MPCKNPKSTKEARFEKTKQRWQNAERGTGGLRKVRFYDFDDLPNERKRELLTEPTILTSEGVESLVVMTIEQFFSLIPENPKYRGPLMMRHNGILFRQVT